LALSAEAWSLSEAEVLSSPALQDCFFFINWKKKEEKKENASCFYTNHFQ
jgi:hypothetical protein